MKSTPRIGIAYPEDREDRFFSSYETGVLAIDAALYVGRELRNLAIYSEAVFRFASGVVYWSAPIYLKFWRGSTARVATLAAGSLTISDGKAAVVSVTSSPSTDYTVTISAVTTIPNDDTSFALFWRQDTSLGVSRIVVRGGQPVVGTRRTRPYLDPAPATVTALIKSGQTVTVGDVVEITATGIQKAAGSSTKVVGVSLTTGTGDGSTYCTYQVSGIVALVVESGQTTVAGESVKLSATANQLAASGTATYTGSIGIALEAVVGNGTLTCDTQLRPLGG
jgi:hypothetical protein